MSVLLTLMGVVRTVTIPTALFIVLVIMDIDLILVIIEHVMVRKTKKISMSFYPFRYQ